LSVVDGLLQTPEYARAVLAGNEVATGARMGRQHILAREEPPPPYLVCVLNEGVLHHQIGSPQAMHDQLAHLVACVSARISIQVVPNSVDRPEVNGAFHLATLDDGSEMAYMETAARGISTGSREDIRTLNESFDRVRSQALPVKMSMDLITRTAEERWV
jgi:hypothetical protein